MHKERSSRQTQAGNIVLMILLAIAVLAILGSTGYLIYTASHKAKPLASTTDGTSSQQVPRSSTTTQSAIQPAQQYLVIAQWGVKLPLSSTISDAYAVASNSGVSFDGKPNFYVGLTHLNGNGCNASNNNAGRTGAIGLLGHSPATQTDPVSGELISQEYPYGTTLGSTYYYYQSRTSGLTCASTSELQSINLAFETAAKHVTAY